jgi:cellulose synthase/poly-beta-1,6-N-acetylglucosamine synthase-like glycosyltransferase
VFALRRLVLTAGAAVPGREPVGNALASATVIAAVRNEEANLPALLASLSRLEYGEQPLCFVFVDDGSHDGTRRVLRSWAGSRADVQVVELPESVGKAEALNRALRAAPETELVAVYDADLRPQPDSLMRLAACFADPRVGAASGYRKPSNGVKNPIAAYAALECIVHQLATQAGKNRLGLNPTTLGGNCVYRRSALAEVGGFPPGAFGEDVEVSLAMAARGWRTRFCRDAVAEGAVVESLRRYWNQHARWTRGLYRSARRASGIESWLVAAGYADRIVLLAALALAAAGFLSPVWPALYFLMPVLAVLTALLHSRVGVRTGAQIVIWALPMFAVDVAATVVASVNAAIGRRLEWPTGSSGAVPIRSVGGTKEGREFSAAPKSQAEGD